MKGLKRLASLAELLVQASHCTLTGTHIAVHTIHCNSTVTSAIAAATTAAHGCRCLAA
jgi:hypothetical protein